MCGTEDRGAGQDPMPADPVIRTDQQRCFDERGHPASCSGTGQEGERRPGRPWPEPRFSADGDTVIDHLTERVWMKDAGKEAFPMSWAEAGRFIASLNADAAASRTDWRLPSRRELFSLVSHDRVNPALPAGNPFDGVFPGYYWSATPCAAAPSQAWYVHMGGGRVFKGMKHGSYMVWPVAGPVYSPYRAGTRGERFSAGAETVLDRATGRMWAKVPGLQRGPVSWAGALSLAAELNERRWAGYRDWRMPGVRELESLVDIERHSPALAGDCFRAPPEGCWTSTTSVYEPAYAWVVYFREGAVGVGFKPKADFGLWPVRTEKG